MPAKHNAADRGPISRIAEFKVAYEEWCRKQTLNDFRSGFPLLRALKSSYAEAYLGYVDSLPAQSRETFVTTLLNSALSHSDANPQAVAERYKFQRHSRMRSRVYKSFFNPIPLIFTDIFKALHVLGPCYVLKGNRWCFHSVLPDCRIETLIEVRSNPVLQYSQSIFTIDGICLAADINLLQWYGISEETTWDKMQDLDPRSLNLLQDVCVRFTRAVPQILSLASGSRI